MEIISTWPQIDDQTDPDIKQLLLTRRDQMAEHGDLEELGTFIIVQPGDTLAAIEQAVGAPITTAGITTWEWVHDHGGVFEAPIILSNDGFGIVLIVPDIEGVDPELLDLLRRDASTES